jgi:hypothetical protein
MYTLLKTEELLQPKASPFESIKISTVKFLMMLQSYQEIVNVP